MKANTYAFLYLLAGILFILGCRTQSKVVDNQTARIPNTDKPVIGSPLHVLQKQPTYHFSRLKLNYLHKTESYQVAFNELEAMLKGQQPADFERAVFISENAYYQNLISYSEFQKILDYHTSLIEKLIQANDRSDAINFHTVRNASGQPFDHTQLRFTPQEKKAMYRKALTNWAIHTYLTDTTYFFGYTHLPFSYQFSDPFGKKDWSNTQVLHLLGSKELKGNCFALVALFKIFANRLHSNAYICTAPQHIYIQHQDTKGEYYNVELATGTYPSDGTLQTITYTHRDAILNGIALRRLETPIQDITLCLVNLGKSYEHRYKSLSHDFMLKCATLALQYDSLNLNALLLKAEVLEERLMPYANIKGADIHSLRIDPATSNTYRQLETQILQLYDLGYYQMPRDMQEVVLATLKQKDKQPIKVKDKTPNPFTSISVSQKDRKYSTLSGGLYEEVHNPKRFEQYGHFVLDTKERKLHQLETDNYSESLIDPVVFAWSVDPMAQERTSWTPYNAFRDNPIINVDPTGALDDFYQDANGEIKWDNNVNSAADLNKPGGPQGTYIGKTLTFNFTSYIDANLWDGPFGNIPAGEKLASTITLTAKENEKGALTGLYAQYETRSGPTPVGEPRMSFPGLGSDQNAFTQTQFSAANGAFFFYLNFEQHASVSPEEDLGLGVLNYDIVNVAQNLKLYYSAAASRLYVSAATDIFPSATLTLNNRSLFQYNQPSFKGTHGHNRTTTFGDNGMGGSTVLDYTPRRPAPAFQLRYNR